MAERLAIRDFGKQISFDGVDDYVDITTNLSTISPTTELTVSAWVKLSARPNSNASFLRGGNDEYGFLFNQHGAGATVSFRVTRQADTTQYASGYPTAYALYPGRWYHIVGTCKVGETVKQYINGTLAVSTPDTFPGADTIKTLVNRLYIGWEGAASRYFPGQVDDVQIYNRALTQTEVTNLYLNGVTPSDSSTSLLASYKFEDNANDLTGTGHNGTVYGATYVTDTPTRARTTATSRTTATNRVAVRDMGTALRFDGVDDKVVATTGNMQVLAGQSRTFSMFIYPTAFNKYLFSRNTGTGDGLRVVLNSSGKINIVWETNVTTINVTSTNSIPLNRWVFLIISVSATSLTINLGGTLTTSSYSTRTFNPSTGLQIGTYYIGGSFFAGIIDEFRVFNTALSATEIQNLYLHGAVPRDGLVAEYLFDEGAGTTALDSSGNGNDGTITGATYTTDTPLQPRTSV